MTTNIEKKCYDCKVLLTEENNSNWCIWTDDCSLDFHDRPLCNVCHNKRKEQGRVELIRELPQQAVILGNETKVDTQYIMISDELVAPRVMGQDIQTKKQALDFASLYASTNNIKKYTIEKLVIITRTERIRVKED